MKIFKGSFIYRNIIKLFYDHWQVHKWEKKGRPSPPPPLIKRRIIIEYANRFTTSTFVETGTYYGDTVDCMKEYFKKIISIELDEELFKKAKKRFRNNEFITIYNGDSGEILPNVLKNISDPCLFWLDGHYSSGETAKGVTETPIIKEINTIISHPNITEHVILIDDARLFNGKNDYPTIEELRNVILEVQPDFSFEVQNDIIRIHMAD